MALQTTITIRTAPTGGTRLYPNIVSYKNIGNDELIEYMVQNSGINKCVAIAAAVALRQAFNNYALNGHTIQIPQLGTFSVGARTKAVTKLADCNASCIQGLKLRFTPVGSTQQACKSVKFQGIIKDEETIKSMIH